MRNSLIAFALLWAAHAAAQSLAAGPMVGATDMHTTTIWLQATATRRFPDGVLYAAHDDEGVGAFAWRDIATALWLPVSCSD